MKAYRHNGASGNAGTGARVPAKPKHSALETGSDLSQQTHGCHGDILKALLPLLDALFGAHPAFSPTVGGTQAERYRTASDAEVDAMDPATVRADLLAEQAQKDAEPWVQPGGPRDLLDVAKERQAMEAARHAPKGLQDGGHAWKLLNYAPKGQYREDIQEGRISSKTKITVGGTSTAATNTCTMLRAMKQGGPIAPRSPQIKSWRMPDTISTRA